MSDVSGSPGGEQDRPADRIFLVVVDETEEMRVALRFACRRARNTGGRVALLYVIEPADFQHWQAVGDLMREEARSEGEQLLQKLAARVKIHIWKGNDSAPESNAPFRISRVAARLKDGRAADITHEKVKGSPEWPLTHDEQRAKFMGSARIAAHSLDRARLAEALASLEAIEDQPNILALPGMLTAQAAMV